jgi:pimeloyl-ACP methyl ester carboxylesterase
MPSVNYKNIDIHYSDAGKGHAVVLLHGFLENRKMWQDLTATLSEKYRVIAIDLLGHGDTGCLGYIHTMEDNADAVYAVLHALHLRKAVFIGHSMGGYVALAFAEAHPETVKGLALVNSTAKEDSPERKANRDRAILAVKENHAGFVRLSVSNLFSDEMRNRLATEIENTKTEALQTPLQGIVASLEGMKIRKNRESLLRSGFPVLLLLGKKDSVLAYDENAPQVDGTLAALVTLPHGHMSTIESPVELRGALLAFLKSI